MSTFLIDTDVLIDVSKGSTNAVNFLAGLTGTISISRISATELVVGARDKRDQLAIENFISHYTIRELHRSTGIRGYNLLIDYTLSHGLTIMDALIAATAIEHDLTLVSKNERHFQHIQSLEFLRARY
jgi:predicted nucleic acid-binding protein